MKTKHNPHMHPRIRGLARLAILATLLTAAVPVQAQLPVPLIQISFSEGSGRTTANAGSLGGLGTLTQQGGFPAFITNVPTGPFAPSGNKSSVDFGIIASGDGGRAIDFPKSTAIPTVGWSGFTLAGWLNIREENIGWGGNRVLTTWNGSYNNGGGFELVQVDEGRLRFSVNEAPDWPGPGPFSSPGTLTIDPQAGANNWIFFAVTYDAGDLTNTTDGSVSYYFGNASTPATLDGLGPQTYDKGAIGRHSNKSDPSLSVGNFNPQNGGIRNERGPNGGSRVLRGLADELQVYNKVLTLAEIQAAQKNPAYQPPQDQPVVFVQQPQSQKILAGGIASFSAAWTGTAPFQMQWTKNGVSIPGATNAILALSGVPGSDNGAQIRLFVTNVVGYASSEPATLNVLDVNPNLVSFSFEEGTGTTTANLGSLGGTATFVQRTNSAGANLVPIFSTKVPTGSYAPTGNRASVDFGVIGEGEGGRAIDLAGGLIPTMGPMTGFTACGWVNIAQGSSGWGGNRVFFALASPAGPGFDIVQLSSGAFQLGVNAWPDGSPAQSSTLLTEDLNLGDANWFFFAVTYDGTLTNSNVNWYWGKGDTEAYEDPEGADTYDKGLILQSGQLTVGNFSTAAEGVRNETGVSTGSRCIRGLVDELKVFNKVLSLAEIRAAQKEAAKLPSIALTALTAKLQGSQIVISWNSASGYQLQSRKDLSTGTWADDNATVNVSSSVSTVLVPASGAAQYFRLRNK